MAGHALVIDDAFPKAKIIGIEPSGADDFRQSLAAKKRVRIAKPESICDGLLSYDVGETNWPILQQCVDMSVVSTDCEIKNAMKWLWEKHGLRTEPSGAISVAACLDRKLDLSGDADVVLVVSGRNIDHDIFDRYLNESKNPKVAS